MLSYYSCILSLFLVSLTAQAFTPSIESYVSTESRVNELKGVFPGGQFGSSVENADINGDGLTDIFVGSPFTSVSRKQWNGATAIILGSKTDTEDKIHIYGENSGDQLGTAISSGDYNNDGIDDVAISAYNAGPENARSGAVYVIYGSVDMPSRASGQEGSQPINTVGMLSGDFVLSKAKTILNGHEDKAQFGMSMLSIDVNKDGFDDLIIGEPGATFHGNKMTGAIYVYPGGKDGISSNYSISMYGQKSNEKFGSILTGGDYNNDDKIDLAISAYASNSIDKNQAGKVYIYENLMGINSSAGSSSTFLEGNSQNGWFGFATDTGDANGDGIDDLLVSSFPYKGDKEDASIFLYHGGEKFMNKKYYDVQVTSPDREALPGASVLLSDLNNDSKADIVIGAPGISHMKSIDPGDVYVIFSSETPYKDKYSIREKSGINAIHGEKSDDWFGYGLKSLDFNNDAIMDLAIGSRYSDTIGGVNNGKVFVLTGKNKPFGRVAQLSQNIGDTVNRAELVKLLFESFDLRSKNADFLQNCYDYKEFCLFNFMAMSSFNELQLSPDLILFPDVMPDSPYYNDVNDATILGLVNGYLDEKDSPFHPERPITRIQALKVIFGAADLVPQKYKFELISIVGSYLNLTNQFSYFYDIDAKIPEMWWYPRYVNFAVENEIIRNGDFFRPNDNITVDELNDLIINTLTLLKSRDEKN